MWFEDLTHCDYFSSDNLPIVAVGWLERGKPYTQGEVDRAIFDALVEMRKNPWQPFISMGTHGCDLCRFVHESSSCANLFIPWEGKIFAAPELIVHYINAHGYAPPSEFCRAVLACPPMRSIEYLKAIKACGGARLLKLPSSGI